MKFRSLNRAVLLALCALFLTLTVLAQQTRDDTSSVPTSTAGSSVESQSPSGEAYLIGPDDVLAVSVWKEPELSRVLPVRSDSRITLPLIGEVVAGGRKPKDVEIEIKERLTKFIAQPEVSVIVQEVRGQTFNVLGEVVRPGSYSLAKRVTVLDAIAMAGGFRDFAKKKSVYVLRKQPNGEQARLPFNYKDVISGKRPEQNIELQPHDTLVIP